MRSGSLFAAFGSHSQLSFRTFSLSLSLPSCQPLCLYFADLSDQRANTGRFRCGRGNDAKVWTARGNTGCAVDPFPFSDHWSLRFATFDPVQRAQSSGKFSSHWLRGARHYHLPSVPRV